MSDTKTNPMYLAYAKANNKAPDEMSLADEAMWPGGVMCGFILFVSDMRKEFYKEHPEAFFNRVDCLFDHSAFHKFVIDKFPSPA